MKRALMTAVTVVLLAAFAYCGWRYYSEAFLPRKQLADAYKAQRELFESIRPDMEGASSAGQPVPDSPGGQENDTAGDPLAELKAVNGEAVGWLTIDGTNIDYPIVQAADNSSYLKKGFDKKPNRGLGCPFLDCRCDSGFTGFDSIVYAHHIKGNQAMFADIEKFKDISFMQKNQTGRLLTADGVHNVRFFAYLTLPSDSFAYNVSFEKETDKEEYIDSIFENARYTAGYTSDELKENKDLHLLLLSTCTYEYWAARGVLAGVIE
ncbi:MAG: class B sortase [Ruminococcus sp.]|nr:class B sortase [Ruminococcus sp.]